MPCVLRKIFIFSLSLYIFSEQWDFLLLLLLLLLLLFNILNNVIFINIIESQIKNYFLEQNFELGKLEQRQYQYWKGGKNQQGLFNYTTYHTKISHCSLNYNFETHNIMFLCIRHRRKFNIQFNSAIRFIFWIECCVPWLWTICHTS